MCFCLVLSESIVTRALLEVGHAIHGADAWMQDILKGSGKLVDNHTVKYSLPGVNEQLSSETGKASRNLPSEALSLCQTAQRGPEHHREVLHASVFSTTIMKEDTLAIQCSGYVE
jgi:hypothetical protein